MKNRGIFHLSMSYTIHTKDSTKAFSNLAAVNGVSFDVGFDDIHIKSTGTKFLLKQVRDSQGGDGKKFQPLNSVELIYCLQRFASHRIP